MPSLVSGNVAAEADQNLIEINRCHVFIDPLCFGRLVKALSIEPPSQRLDLPKFFMENPDNSNYSGGLPQPLTLSAEERKTIAEAADGASGTAAKNNSHNPELLLLMAKSAPGWTVQG